MFYFEVSVCSFSSQVPLGPARESQTGRKQICSWMLTKHVLWPGFVEGDLACFPMKTYHLRIMFIFVPEKANRRWDTCDFVFNWPAVLKPLKGRRLQHFFGELHDFMAARVGHGSNSTGPGCSSWFWVSFKQQLELHGPITLQTCKGRPEKTAENCPPPQKKKKHLKNPSRINECLVGDVRATFFAPCHWPFVSISSKEKQDPKSMLCHTSHCHLLVDAIFKTSS